MGMAHEGSKKLLLAYYAHRRHNLALGGDRFFLWLERALSSFQRYGLSVRSGNLAVGSTRSFFLLGELRGEASRRDCIYRPIFLGLWI
jgi:hypothetical protein